MSSYPRCILTGELIDGECMVFLLGPHGCGNHDKPPQKSPGGCNLPTGANDSVVYWPLTLPVQCSVGDNCGEIESVVDSKYNVKHEAVLGIESFQSLFDTVVEDGSIPSMALQRAAEIVREEDSKLGKSLPAVYNKLVKHSWMAKWADIAHVSMGAWTKLCVPSQMQRKKSAVWHNKKSSVSQYSEHDWYYNADDYYPICKYSVLAYRDFLHEDEARELLDKLVALIRNVSFMHGELRPSVIFRDEYRDTSRLQILEYMFKQEKKRIEQQNG